MENQALVSIIVPVYNVAQYLAEALDSAICQTYPELEIILVDDGSTDESGGICDAYAAKDRRIRVIHQENKGLSAARNAGLDAMTGTTVAFLDSDDAFHPDYIKVMMEAMNRHQADLVVCRFSIHWTVGKMIQKGQDKAFPAVKSGLYDRRTALRMVADGTINPGVWNKLYSSKFFKTIRFPEGHVYENVDTTFRVFDLCETVCAVPQPLYLYRKRPGAITDKVSRRNVEDWVLARSHFESFIKENTPDVYAKEDLTRFYRSRIKQMMNFYAILSRNKEDKAYSETFRNTLIATMQKIGVKNCDFLTKAGYRMICDCPWAFRSLYPVLCRARRLL